MKPAAIATAEAVCNLGGTWDEIWQNLLKGMRLVRPYSGFDPRFPSLNVNVACAGGVDRTILDDPIGAGACCYMLGGLIRQITDIGGGKIEIFGATNHGEADAFTELVGSSISDPTSSKAQRLFADMGRDATHRQAALSSPGIKSSAWVYSACTSSLHALSLALASLARSGTGSVAVLAADAVSVIGVAGFYRAGALGRQGHCAPFDPASEALLIGEGAAGLLLSQTAQAGAIIITGVGMSCDAGHPAHPDPTGRYLECAILSALGRAGKSPGDIGLVVAHGTGTAANDKTEAAVLARVFGATKVPVTSIKGMIGHCMGAAGLFNILAAERALREGIAPAAIPATRSVDGVDLILGQPREIDRAKSVLVLGAGFGGNNVAVILDGPH